MSTAAFGEYTAALLKGTWMHKPGSKGGFRLVGGSKWNRRHVWIESGALHYGPSERKSEKSIPLHELKAVRACAEKEIEDEKGPQQLAKNGWRLSTVDKVIIFVAEKSVDRDQWVQGLNVYLRRKNHQGDDELDEDDELTYRQIRESSRTFVEERTSRSMSMYSNAHFNTEEIDELLEEEESMRNAYEQKMRKDFADIKAQFFDELDHTITKEEVRARSQSQASPRDRTVSSLVTDEEFDLRTAEAALQAAKEELNQKHISQQNAVLDEELASRDKLNRDEIRVREDIVQTFQGKLIDIASEMKRAEDAARVAFQKRQADARSEICFAETQGRSRCGMEVEEQFTLLKEKAATSYRDAQLKTQQRLEAATKALRETHQRQRADVVGEESAARISVHKEESIEWTNLLSRFDREGESIRNAEMQRIQDQAERRAAMATAARKTLIGEESTARSSMATFESNAWEELSIKAENSVAVAVATQTARLDKLRAEFLQAQEERCSKFAEMEATSRNQIISGYREHCSALSQTMLVEGKHASDAAALRIEKERQQFLQAQDKARKSFAETEHSQRTRVSDEEGKLWMKSIITAGQESRRQAEKNYQDRLKREADARRQQRELLFQNETAGRKQVLAVYEQELASLKKTASDQRAVAVKRMEHRVALHIAAQTHLIAQDAEPRAAIENSCLSELRWLISVISVIATALQDNEKTTEQEIMDRAGLRIAYDAGIQEACEAFFRRTTSSMQEVCDLEESQRTSLHARESEAWETLSGLIIRNRQRIDDALRARIHFVERSLAQRTETEGEEDRERSNIMASALDSKSQAALAEARRRNDAAAIAHQQQEVSRSHVMREEVEGRCSIEQEEDEEWRVFPEVFEKKRLAVEAKLQEEQNRRGEEAQTITTTSRSGSPTAATPTSPPRETTSADRASTSNGSTARQSNVQPRRETAEEKQRQRAATLRQFQEDAEAQWKAERKALHDYVQRGSWMCKPGSQSSKGTSVFRLGGNKWNKRFVWVRNNAVCYGEKPDKPEKPLPFSTLRKATVVTQFDAEREGCPKELQQFVWRLSSIEKTIFFACQTADDRAKWIKFLEVVTGQTDMESAVTSMKSQAFSGHYEPSDNGDDNDDDDENNGNDRPFEEDEICPEVPQTLEEWLAVLKVEEREERAAMVAAEARFRLRTIATWEEDDPRKEKIETQSSTDNNSMPQKYTAASSTLSQRSSMAAPPPAQPQQTSQTSRTQANESTLAPSQSTTIASPARERSETVARRADAAAQQAAAEAEERKKIVFTGAWMFKPRSKSTTSSSFLRSISAIGGATWNKRFLWVNDKSVVYGEKPGKAEKTVPLSAIQSVYAVSPDAMKAEGAPKNLWTFGFKLTADDRSIMWAAQDAKTRRAFIEFLTPMARRQPSGLQARSALVGSVNNDLADLQGDDDEAYDDPFADDAEYAEDADAASNRGNEPQLPEVPGGPIVRVKRGGRSEQGTVSRLHPRDPKVPLMSLQMFVQQVDGMAALRKEEGLVGLAVVNGDGLCIRSTGEADAALSGRAGRLVCIANALRMNPRASSPRRASSIKEDPGRSSPRLKSSHPSLLSAAHGASALVSIEIETEGPHNRIISIGSVASSLEVLFVALHHTK